jgi:diguanylate cyclase (GGDEF)-like protein/PAS domain S-box-containing protein
MFERYDLGPLDSVALRRDDRRLVARFAPGSPVQGEVGDVNISAPLRAALQAHPRSGSVVSRVAVDGQERTTAYRALDSWPFVVFTGVANDRFFEPWRRQVWTVTSLAALAWLLVTAALWMLCRASRREDDAMQALANQGRRIQALLHTAGDGIHIMDATGHLVEMSDSFADMLRSSRARLMGRHISSWDVNQDKATIDAWLARIKPGDRQRVDVQHRRDDGQVIDVEIQLSITEIAAQLFVFASARDVTNERRLMREQQAMLDSDLVGMAKIESRVITWRNRAAERMLGYGEGELQGQPVRIVYWDDAEYDRVGLEGYDALRQHRRYRSQVRMRRKSGELVWIDFSAVPLSDTEVFAMLVDITATRAAHESLVHAAFHDALTQLPNRVLLHDRIGQARAAARREDAAVAVCYLDLDGFKAVNDTHGHDAGDHLLKTIADRLVRAVRACDTVSRMGGDEFVLVLAPVSDGEWQPILRRVIDTIGDPVALPAGPEVRVGVTAGVAIVTADDDAGAQQWIERADQAMLHGKRHGKGQVSVDPASPVGSAGPNGRETRAESGGRWPSRA